MTIVKLDYFISKSNPFPRWLVFWKGRCFEFGSESESWDRAIAFLKERNVTAKLSLKEQFFQDLRRVN